MKKLLVFPILFILINLQAQQLKPIAKKLFDKKANSEYFSLAQPFTYLQGQDEKSISLQKIAHEASFFQFNKIEAEQILEQSPENLNLIVPFQNGASIELELFKSSIFSADFSVITADNNSAINYREGLHYWGIIKGNYNSIVAISIFEDEVMGLISSGGSNLVLGKLKDDESGIHILYNDKKLVLPNTLACSTEDSHVTYNQKQLQNPSLKILQNCIRLYWEINYDIFQDKGSITSTVNYITGLFNESAILYANDNIPVTLSQVYVWNISSPYTSASTAGLLGQFQSYRNSFNGDIGHLLGYAGGGGIAAGFSGLCASNLDDSQCYSGIASSYQTVPLFSWSVEVVTHEQGHLMGSRHTHACVWNGNNTAIDGCAGYVEGGCSLPGNPVSGGTIMSYCHLVNGVGINFNNGFGSQPAAVILNNFNNALCLTSCSGIGCFPPSNLADSSITTTTATLTWDSVPGASNYYVRYRIVGTSTWILDSSFTNFYNATGLAPGNTYEWQVQTGCSGGNSSFTSSANFVTVPLVCNAPVSLTTTAISSSSVTLNWPAVGGAVNYTIQYREVGTIPYNSGVSATNFYNVVGLNPSTSYEWHVQSVCAGGGISSLSIDSFFTTLLPALPIACYPFSGNANDASGNGHHGTVIGPQLTTDRFGNPNSAYNFDGVDDYINLGNYASIIASGNNFSMSVWIKANVVKIQTILMINPDNFNDRLNCMAYYSHNGQSTTFLDYGNCTNGGRLQLIGTPFFANWEHYVFIVNNTLGNMQVYRNGVLQVSKTGASTLTNRNKDLRIGGAYDNASAPFFFNGKIDDMAIYDQALSAQEVQTLFAQQILCLNSVGLTENNFENETALFPTLSSNGILNFATDIRAKTLNCKVFDYLGKELKSVNIELVNGKSELNFAGLANGLYFLQVANKEITKNFKFVIQQ